MEELKPRIEFYRQRTFSEKLNVVFEFIRENWRPLLKYSFYIIMPVCLIQTFAMNTFVGFYLELALQTAGNNPFGGSMVSFLVNYGVLMLCILIGSAMMSGLIYAMMQTYAVRENRLRDVTINDFKALLIRNTGKYCCLLLAILVVFSLIAAAMALLAAFATAWSLAITIPLLIVAILLMIPLALVPPTYIFERDITFVDAIRKAWKLGISTLAGMLGLMVVLYFVSSVIQTVSMLPWYITIFAGSIFSATTESAINQSAIFKFVLYIFGLIQSYGMYVSTIIGIIGLAFQYFHAREKVEGVTIESNISNFSNF